ncbi:serine protease inhibitor [Lentinula aff. detonsa]|uniref:Serine protease inhibitor n=1 Tax=Lentinula aff. detonsa TaxID=2804958 RepID=A0AA38NSR2_9AGAR|nr:serine protease inhibitor [Lentinula aff. detonsa]
MSLETGRYIIISGDYAVGRHFPEDRSLLPKGIFLIPKDWETNWVFEKSGNQQNEYTITSNGSPTAHIDGAVVALLTELFSVTKWIVEAVPQHGHNAYIITTPEHDQGWVSSEEVGQQILVKPLIATHSLPPQYLRNGVFQIIKVE